MWHSRQFFYLSQTFITGIEPSCSQVTNSFSPDFFMLLFIYLLYIYVCVCVYIYIYIYIFKHTYIHSNLNSLPTRPAIFVRFFFLHSCMPSDTTLNRLRQFFLYFFRIVIHSHFPLSGHFLCFISEGLFKM
jgi:hypothetical protein